MNFALRWCKRLSTFGQWEALFYTYSSHSLLCTQKELLLFNWDPFRMKLWCLVFLIFWFFLFCSCFPRVLSRAISRSLYILFVCYTVSFAPSFSDFRFMRWLFSLSRSLYHYEHVHNPNGWCVDTWLRIVRNRCGLSGRYIISAFQNAVISSAACGRLIGFVATFAGVAYNK